MNDKKLLKFKGNIVEPENVKVTDGKPRKESVLKSRYVSKGLYGDEADERIPDCLWHTDLFTRVVSPLTNREIIINLSQDKYLISPTWQRDKMELAINEWLHYVAELISAYKPRLSVRNAAQAIIGSDTREEFGLRLDDMLHELWDNRDRSAAGEKSMGKVAHLLRLFWSLNCIAWPTYRWSGVLRAQNSSDALGWGEQLSFVRSVEAAIPPHKVHNRFRLMVFALLSMNNLKEGGDLAPSVLDIANYRENPMWKGVLKSWCGYLNTKYKPSKYITYLDFGAKRMYRINSREDENFAWAIEKSKDMRLWINEASEFVNIQKSNKGGTISHINKFFDYLVATPDTTRNPVEYIGNTYPKELRFDINQLNISTDSKNAIHNKLSEFIDFVLHRHCMEPDDTGHLYLRPGFFNPHQKIPLKKQNNGETHRQVMPTRLLRAAFNILMEDIVRDVDGNPLIDANGHVVREEFAWAKRAMRQVIGFGDYFSYIDPVTLVQTKMWSPVRMAVLLLKLLLPARTFQIRFQESDERDTEILGPDGWIPNNHQLTPQYSATRSEIVERGALRKFTRRDGSIGTHIFFNTNKTGDIGVEPSKRGYVMPWERKEAIDVYRYMSEWQRKFNPVKSSTKWTDIEEMKKRKQIEELELMGSATFLFRDPTEGTGAPISDAKVRTFWMYVLDELEKRLYRSGDRLPDGSPIRLVPTRNHHGIPISVAYDLHTLRVTAITLLYEEGVPIEIIMKIVGHASILMSLYYTKIHHEDISAKCDAAVARAAQKEQAQWASHIARLSREELRAIVAYVHDDGLNALTKANGHSLIPMPHGICPVQKSKCHVGLVNPEKEGRETTYGPVPGLSRNCARCRFFVTGVKFIEGLAAYITEKSYLLKEESREYEEIQKNFDELQYSISRMLELGEPVPEFQRRERDNAERRYEDILIKTDEAARNFSAAFALHSQVEALLKLRSEAQSDGYALVAVGGWEQLESELRDVHEFQLLDRICRQAEVYDGLQIDWSKANLQRLRYYNRILVDSGYEPVFDLILGERECLQIGNELGRFLYDKIGEDGVEALMERKTTLRALGLNKEFEEKLSSLTPVKVSFQSASSLLEV
jgi:hypothetical protein